MPRKLTNEKERSTGVTITMTPSTLARLDALCERLGASRGGAVVFLMDRFDQEQEECGECHGGGKRLFRGE